jgi:hypothetical protein
MRELARRPLAASRFAWEHLKRLAILEMVSPGLTTYVTRPSWERLAGLAAVVVLPLPGSLSTSPA